MKDRTFKLLLALVAVALWGIVLRPLWEPATAQAQGDQTGKSIIKYEYSFEVGGNSLNKLMKELDKWGENGWRAVDFEMNTFQTIVLLEKQSE